MMKTVALAGVVLLVVVAENVDAKEPIIGFTEPFQTIDLAASETGTLMKLNVSRGDSVSANQEVGSLDMEVLQARRDLAQARVESDAKMKAAQIRVDRAKRQYEKFKELHEEGHGAVRELEISETDYRLSQADLVAVQDERRLSELELRRTEAEINRRRIVCPINGVVTSIQRDVGEYVSVAEPHVLTIVDLTKLRVRFYPSTAIAENYNLGDNVRIRFIHSGKIVSAKIEFIAPVIDADSDTIRVDVILDNREQQHRSGRRSEFMVDHRSVPSTPSKVPGRGLDRTAHGHQTGALR